MLIGNEQSINDKLEILYKKYWDDFIQKAKSLNSNISNEKLQVANPLLIKVNEEEYMNSDIKVMIYGQETFGWHELDTPIKDEMCKYESFINNKPWKMKTKSSFWKAFKFFKDELSNSFPDKKISFLWNNISKIGRKKSKGVSDEIRALERVSFPVVLEEIKILIPDIVIFLTGNRNRDIKFHFEDVKFESCVINSTLKSKKGNMEFKPVSKVTSQFLPQKSVKLYHPSFFGGFNNVKDDAVGIISNVKNYAK